MNKRTRLRDQGSVSQRLEGGREFAVLCQEVMFNLKNFEFQKKFVFLIIKYFNIFLNTDYK